MSLRKATSSQIAEFSRILDKRVRKQSGLFQIEGLHLVEEMLRSERARPRWIGITEDFMDAHSAVTKSILRKYQANVFGISARELRKMTDTEHPQGIVAIVEQQRPAVSDLLQSTTPVLLMDGISDPGNLGTVIRTADWFGIEGILLTPDCVDWYNPKVVRSSMGSIFRVDSAVTSIESAIEEAGKHGRPVLGATGEGEVDSPIPTNAVLVMGNESRGLSKEIRNRCDALIGIAGAGRTESLNVAVASGILLFKAMKGRT